jgi:hypothetical protein
MNISTSSNNHVGKILNIGADWLLVDRRGNARPDTRYNLQTDDGAYIYVQTEGPSLADDTILLRGKFETDTNGTYAWMNDRWAETSSDQHVASEHRSVRPEMPEKSSKAEQIN